MKKKFVEILLFLLFLAGLFCLGYGIEQYAKLSDPLKEMYFWSGWISFAFLLFGLFAKSWGRFFGLCAWAFALFHLMLFIYFDFYFEWHLMKIEMMQKRYLYYGIISLALMCVLGYFSFVGKFYRFLFWGVIASIVLALVHIVMIQKILGIGDFVIVVSVFVCLVLKIKKRILN